VIKPIKPKRQVFAEPVTSIEAKGYREYFRKVDETAAASADYLHTHRAVMLRGPASVIVVQVPLGHSPAQTGYSKPCPCCFLYTWHGSFGFRGTVAEDWTASPLRPVRPGNPSYSGDFRK